MIPDRLQYCLDDFWNFEKCDQLLTLGPRIYQRNLQRMQEIYGSILENIFVNMGLNIFVENVRTMYVTCTMFIFFGNLSTYGFMNYFREDEDREMINIG